MFAKRCLAIMASISTAIALTVIPSVQTNFDPKSNSNMAVYWGQGPSQQRLAHFCEDSNIDIIPIAFLNIFPDQVNGGYPGTNFGNQCGAETYKNKDGSSSLLLSNCPFIGPDIKTCQAMGKKILLSLGGAIPTNQSIKDDDSAKSFAKFLWNAFGPVDVTYDGPRPFGDAVVDGFDFDIESAISDNDASTQYRGYGTMIDTLRLYFATDVQKQYYISGAPQCVIPDAHLAHPIETSWFDFLFIQFYNTPQCSARAYFDATYGSKDGEPSDISFDAWVGFIRTTAMNKDVKLYIGLPAAPLTQLVYDTKMYIAPDDVVNLIDTYQCRYPQEFGGIMVFEATYSEQNLIDNKPFVDVVKKQLTDSNCAQKPRASSSSTSTTSSSATSPTIASSTSTTSSLNSSSSALASASASLPSYPSSTGVWNTTRTSRPTAPIGTGSSAVGYPSSSGIWNTTTSSTTPIGTGSSSIPPYPSSTGIWNATTSSTPIGTGSSFIPPYPTSTGVWNSTSVSGPTAPLSTGTGYHTSSILVNSSTSSTSVSSFTSASSPDTTSASGGFSSSTFVTSAPYPVTNGTLSPTTTASGGIIYTTETITVTSCPPEVTKCPVRTSVTIYPITTSTSGPVTSVPTGSPETTTPGSSYLTVDQTPATTIPIVPGVTTTKIVTSYVTTCPVTGTTTVHGSTSVYTSSTVSAVYTTIVSTVPVVPVPTGGSPSGQGSPSGPAPSHGGSSSPSSPPSNSGNSPTGSGSHPAPQPEQPAHGGSPSPSHGSSSPSSSNGNSPIGAGNSPSTSSGSQPLPSSGQGSTSGSNNSPAAPAHGAGSPSPSPNTGNNPVQPVNNAPSQPQGPVAPGLSTTFGTATRQITATVQNNPAGSSAPGANNSPQGETTASSLPAVVTETIVPVPLYPSQTAHPAGGSSSTNGLSPVQATPSVPSAPFPAGNGTVGAGPSGSAAPSASVSGFVGGSSGTVPFTGAAAGKMGMSLFTVILGAVGVVIMM